MEVVRRKRAWLWSCGRLFGQVPVAFGFCQCRQQRTRTNPKSVRPTDHNPAPGFETPPSYGSLKVIDSTWFQHPSSQKGCQCSVNDVLNPSLFWTAYSVCLVLILLPCSILVHLVEIKKGEEGKSPRMTTRTDKVVTSCDLMLVLLTASAAVLQACFSRKDIPQFVKQLKQVDKLLCARPPRVPWLFLVWLISMTTLSIMDICLATMIGGVEYGWLFVPAQTTYFFVYVMEVLFADDAHCISTRFCGLNVRLESVCLMAVRRNPYSEVTVHHLEDAHAMLCISSRNVTRRFGPLLLIDMLNLMTHLVITAYYLFSKILLDSRDPLVFSTVALQIMWLLGHISRILLMVVPCARARDEANKTGALVGKYLNALHPSSVTHKQLEMFSMQLMHHRVTFSACGLFELDLPLVVSILGAVTTYLVVLLQLKSPTSSNN